MLRWLMVLFAVVLCSSPVLAQTGPHKCDNTSTAVLLCWATAGRPATPGEGVTGYNTDLNTIEWWNGTAWVSGASAALASWTTATRPTTPSIGQIGYNADTGALEYWDNKNQIWGPSAFVFPVGNSTSPIKGPTPSIVRNPSEQKGNVIDVMDYGARCDLSSGLPVAQQATDDGPAINAAILAARNIRRLMPTAQAKIVFPPNRLCLIRTTIDLTSDGGSGFGATVAERSLNSAFRQYGLTVEGAHIFCQTDGAPCIDMMGSCCLVFRDMRIWGDGRDTYKSVSSTTSFTVPIAATVASGSTFVLGDAAFNFPLNSLASVAGLEVGKTIYVRRRATIFTNVRGQVVSVTQTGTNDVLAVRMDAAAIGSTGGVTDSPGPYTDWDLYTHTIMPSVGVQAGRTFGSGGCGQQIWIGISIDGSFRTAAHYNLACEGMNYYDVYFQNRNMLPEDTFPPSRGSKGPHAVVFDGNNHFNLPTIAPGGQQEEVDSLGLSFNGDIFVSGGAQHFSPITSNVYANGMGQYEFRNAYFSNGNTSSTSTVAIGAGIKDFVSPNIDQGYKLGDRIRFNAVNDATRFMEGPIRSYYRVGSNTATNPSLQHVVVDVDTFGGVGSIANWTGSPTDTCNVDLYFNRDVFYDNLTQGIWDVHFEANTSRNFCWNSPNRDTPNYAATSATNINVSLGSKTLTTQAGLAYENMLGLGRVRLTSAANSGAWMEGLLTCYNFSPLACDATTMIFTVDKIGPVLGARSDWIIEPKFNPVINSFRFATDQALQTKQTVFYIPPERSNIQTVSINNLQINIDNVGSNYHPKLWDDPMRYFINGDIKLYDQDMWTEPNFFNGSLCMPLDGATFLTPQTLSSRLRCDYSVPTKSFSRNGDFLLDQIMESTAVVTAANNVITDGWTLASVGVASSLTWKRDTVLPPPGQSHYLTMATTAVSAAAVGTQYLAMRQGLDGGNITDLVPDAFAKQGFNVDFWLKASAPGTYSLAINGGNQSYVTEVVVDQANVWQWFHKHIPSSLSATWVKTYQQISMLFYFPMSVGSSFRTSTVDQWINGTFFSSTNATQPSETLNATFQVAAFHAYPGWFQKPHQRRSTAETFQEASRYLVKSFPQGTPVAVNGGGNVTTLGGVFPQGTGYLDGTYVNFSLLGTGGTAVCTVAPSANIVVGAGGGAPSGQIASVVMVRSGQGCKVGDIFTSTSPTIGATGTGMSVPVTAINYAGAASITLPYAFATFANITIPVQLPMPIFFNVSDPAQVAINLYSAGSATVPAKCWNVTQLRDSGNATVASRGDSLFVINCGLIAGDAIGDRIVVQWMAFTGL